jgi:signal transduction histidine kinase
MKFLHSAFPSNLSPETIIFAIIGNVLWIAIYVLLVKNARKNEFVEMPFFILIGNMVWEGLYGFVLPVESALSPVLQWGTKGWFILDCFIFAFALRYAKSSISTPLILRHIASVSLALIVLWGTLVYAIAYDGAPVVGMDAHHVMHEGFVRETKSAFLLGIIISVTYVFQYLRLYQQRVFLPSVAWLKMFGNAAATVAIAFYAPFNELLVVLGVLTFIADVIYIALRFVLPNTAPQHTQRTQHSAQAAPEQPLNASDYVFPPNPKFDELWANNPQYAAYFECRGLKLRMLQMPHWSYTTDILSVEIAVLEGAILFQKHKGIYTAEGVRRSVDTATNIEHEMGWELITGNTIYAIDDGRQVHRVEPSATKEAIKNYRKFEFTVKQFLVVSGFIGNAIITGTNLVRYVTPSRSSASRYYLNVEDAVAAMLNVYFSRSAAIGDDEKDFRQSILPDTTPYHQERIQQLFTLLSKIESLEVVEDVPIPEIPNNDAYIDVFRALVTVLEDKKVQIEQAERYAQELEQQANQIQLANNELTHQNQELSVLNAEKNELMGILAHDLKNPIGAVRGLAELIQEDFLEPAEVPTVSGQIVTVADRMFELVKNLLDLNHMESGGMHIEMMKFDIAPMVESTVWQYASQAKAKNITLHFESTAEHSVVHVGEQAVMQVLDNLISNAVKYSPHGKNIFVRLKSSTEAGSEAVRVEIQDEGPGISAEDQKKLFGKFARLSAQPTGGEHSTGLGLSIVKKMVEAMNGRVWCESVLGKGATFVVELPKAQA